MRAAAAPAATPPPTLTSSPAQTPAAFGADVPGANARNGLDQLARIEDKTARIEEKYARSEALLQRLESVVEAATTRMHHVASQADLTAVRDQVTATAIKVRRLPGLTALVSVAIVTALLTASVTATIIFLLLERYGLR
jgi:hypothetical protein